jgi:hypothetical protein
MTVAGRLGSQDRRQALLDDQLLGARPIPTIWRCIITNAPKPSIERAALDAGVPSPPQ